MNQDADFYTSLSLYMMDGIQWDIVADDEPQVDAAVDSYLLSGRDSLLHLRTTSGLVLRVRASRVTHWCVSTPQTRQRVQEINAALRDELRDNRHRAGLPWSEGDYQ